MGDLSALAERADAYARMVEAADPIVAVAARSVVEAFQQLSRAEVADITDLLTGNPVADRARLETAEAAGYLNTSIDWAQVPGQAFKIARTALELAVLGASFL